jgi:hypothetical protein
MASIIKVDTIQEKTSGSGITFSNTLKPITAEHINLSSNTGKLKVTNIDTLQLFQNIYFATGAVATGTAVIPFDDTIPESNEGTQFLATSFTPKFTDSIIEIDYSLSLAGSVAARFTSCLFISSSVNCLSANFVSAGISENIIANGKFIYPTGIGSLSNVTFSVRGGLSTAGTVTLNGFGGNRIYGGVMDSYISIKEYK